MIYKVEYCKYLTDIINDIGSPRWYEFKKRRRLRGMTGNYRTIWAPKCLSRLEEIRTGREMDIVEQFNAIHNIVSSWLDGKIETYDEFVISTRDKKLKDIL